MARLLKNWLLIISVVVGVRAIAQAQITNYVTNGGFERTGKCVLTPSVYSYIINAGGWDEIVPISSTYWIHPCYVQLPYNHSGINFPRSDSGYVSFDGLCYVCSPEGNRGYVRNYLKQPLNSKAVYCITFYVNTSEYFGVSIDAMGAYFGGSELDTIKKASIPLTYLHPQVENPPFHFFTDTVGWMKVSGTFTAQGGEKYMVIGNFKSNAATNTLISNPDYPPTGTIVHVDDVSCIPIDLPAYAGRDTTCIPGTKVYIGRPKEVGLDDDCAWFQMPVAITPTTPPIGKGAGIWVSPTSTATYVVQQDICGVIKYDTVVVFKDGVGLPDLQELKQAIRLYPSPAQHYLQLQALQPLLAQNFTALHIVDATGKVVIMQPVSFDNNRAQINISTLPPGIYSLVLYSNTGMNVSYKWVKE